LTGWTWDYVEDTLTVSRLQALHKEWKRHPPLALMVAAYLGITPPEEKSGEELLQRLQAMATAK